MRRRGSELEEEGGTGESRGEEVRLGFGVRGSPLVGLGLGFKVGGFGVQVAGVGLQ